MILIIINLEAFLLKKFDEAFKVDLLCGVDEVGRGPGAGPVVACAIIMPNKTSFELKGDSKKYTKKQFFHNFARISLKYKRKYPLRF